MSRFRVSILSIMGAVALLALGFAALRSGSVLWLNAVYTATVGILLVAAVGAPFRPGAKGAFWFGFAMFGWGFFLVDLALPSRGAAFGLDMNVDGWLLSSQAVLSIIQSLPSPPKDPENYEPLEANRVFVAHLMLTMAIAAAGGLTGIALRYSATRESGKSPSTKRVRVLILGMTGTVASLAVAFAALRSGSDLWFSAVYTLTLGTLLVAAVAARFGPGTTRAFWFGFAVFGWGLFLVNRGLILSLRAATWSWRRLPGPMSSGAGAHSAGIALLVLTLAMAAVGGLVAIALNHAAARTSGIGHHMSRRRVWILGTIGTVAFLGVGWAALQSGSHRGFSGVYTLTIGALLLATVAARFRPGAQAAFWFGFVTFGWGFLVVDLGLMSSPYTETANPGLLTSLVIARIIPHLRGQAVDLPDVRPFAANTNRVAHLILTLFIAVVGGWVAVALKRAAAGTVSREHSSPHRRMRYCGILGGLPVISLIALSVLCNQPAGPYFPDLAFIQHKEENNDRVERYTKHLRALGEESLWKRAQTGRNATVFRLLWLADRNHPVCVRIGRAGDQIMMHVLVLDSIVIGNVGAPGSLVINKTMALSAREWNDLERRVKQANFWTIPTDLEPGGSDSGDHLILEGVHDKEYHIVNRWRATGEYAALCRFMLKLSGLDVSAAWTEHHEDESANPASQPTGLR